MSPDLVEALSISSSMIDKPGGGSTTSDTDCLQGSEQDSTGFFNDWNSSLVASGKRLQLANWKITMKK